MFSDVKANEQSGKPSIPSLLFSCLFLSLPYSTQHHYNQPCNEHTDKDKKVFLKKKKSMKGASIPSKEKRKKNIDSVHETQIKPYRPARSQAMCSSEKDTLLLLCLHLSQSKFQRVLKYRQKALSNGWSAISYIPCVHVVLDIKAHSVLGHWPKWSHEPHSYHWSQKTTPYLPVMITSTQFVDMSVTTTDKPFSREHLPRWRDYMIKWYSQVKGINP